MSMLACVIACRCGGRVTQLIDHTAYILTEDHQIVFAGICDKCGEDVHVTRDILSLVMLCPNKENVKGN